MFIQSLGRRMYSRLLKNEEHKAELEEVRELDLLLKQILNHESCVILQTLF